MLVVKIVALCSIKNIPTDMEINLLQGYLSKHYGTVTYAEILTACELNLSGALSEYVDGDAKSVEHFQLVDATFISNYLTLTCFSK